MLTLTGMVLTATVAISPLGGSAAVAEAPDGPTFNLFIPGTWETSASANPAHATGALAAVARTVKRAHGDRATIYFLPYMARAFDNGRTYAASKSTAIANASRVLAARAAADPTVKFTITGYSQGADAAGDLAVAIGKGRGPIPADRVLAVGLLADPGNGTAGQFTVGPAPRGTGIADPRPDGMGALSGKVASICAPGDLYCSIDKRLHPVLGEIGTLLAGSADQAIEAVEDAIDVIGTLGSIDHRALGSELTRLPQLIAAGELRSAHRVAGSVNQRLKPLVALANAVDYGRVAEVLDLIPDRTGVARVGAGICRVLARMDLERTAELIGQTQELAWAAAGVVATQQGAEALPETAVEVRDAPALGRKLVSLVARTILEEPTKTSSPDRAKVLSDLVAPEFVELGRKLSKIVAANAVTDPASIIRDVVVAKDFYEGHAHTNYGRFVVDGRGRNAISWLGAWLAERIASAGAER